MTTKQSEVLTLQTKIISWFQQQILLQPHPTTIETKTMMELLGQALQYHATLIDLEESSPVAEEKRASKETSVKIPEPIVEPKTTIVAESTPEVVDEEPSSGNAIGIPESKNDREYFSLAYAHADAVKKGCQLGDRTFRDQLVKGETLFGWRKQDGMGSKPCYYTDYAMT